MNTNQKIRRIGGIVVILMLCGMLLPVFCKKQQGGRGDALLCLSG